MEYPGHFTREAQALRLQSEFILMLELAVECSTSTSITRRLAMAHIILFETLASRIDSEVFDTGKCTIEASNQSLHNHDNDPGMQVQSQDRKSAV